MRVGIRNEIKADEHRVAITPAGVRELVDHGNEVVVQRGAGRGSAIADHAYLAQGARIVADAEAVFAEAEMLVKVKEPQPVEVETLRPDRVLFTYCTWHPTRHSPTGSWAQEPPASPTRPSRTATAGSRCWPR